MDETNRAGAILASVFLICLALIVILLAWGRPDESITRIADLSNFLGDHNTDATKLLITFGGLIVVLLGLTVVIFELAPPQTGSVRVAKVGSGEARIGTDEITRRLEDELRTVPRLRGAEARVFSRGSRAEVRLELYVDTEADVAQTANEAIQRTREIVESRMGVELDSPPKAEVHYSEQPGGKSRPMAASAPLTAAPSTPSWRPAESNTASSDEPSSSGPVHEASKATHEDQPSGV
jgi:hypothetical protein